MKTYEIPVKITSEGKMEFPDDVLATLPREQEVRVIIFVPESGDVQECNDWTQLATEQFFAGYSEADSIYDRI